MHSEHNTSTWWQRNRGTVAAMVLTLIYLVANALLLKHDSFYLCMLPLACLVAILLVLKLETGIMLTALLTPFAVNMAPVKDMELSMPVEPMMILISVVFLFRLLLQCSGSRAVMRHPVSLLVGTMLAWMLVCSCTSQLPLVSFKHLAAQLWFIVPFFLAASHIFSNEKRIAQFFWSYAAGLIAVVTLTTLKTIGNFSDLQTLHRVMRPFYNDHTAYGCVIALMMPAAFYFIRNRKAKGWLKLIFAAMFILLVVGLMFSYSRAAWLSVVAAVAVYVAVKMGVKVRWMILAFALGSGLFFAYQSDVLYKLSKNKQDSSYDIAGQVKSISNISTDASNLERLNRWAAAIRMWEEHPIAGCGPGTYQFLYAPYQRSYQLSTISTNFGNHGNAHSEYIGPLAEQGTVGLLLVIALYMTTFATGIRLYRTLKDRNLANMALAFTLSLFTYYVHGIFNNFLDTDKLSVPFWGFTAVIVALDAFAEKKPVEEKKPTTA